MNKYPVPVPDDKKHIACEKARFIFAILQYEINMK